MPLNIKLLIFSGVREIDQSPQHFTRSNSDTPRGMFYPGEVCLMLSVTKLKTTVMVASVALLCTSPLVAALKTRPSAIARSSSHVHLQAARVSSKISSHKTSKMAVASTRGHKGKVQTVKYQAAAKPKSHGQQAIGEARTLEIQQALIREHYLEGEATGQWDQATRDALTRLQNDNHWQTKIIPDARALIKLGLGPSQQNLLNPESAAMAMPYQSGIEKPTNGGSN